MREIRVKFARLWSIIIGLAGAYLTILSLAPVLLSGRNSGVISEWRDVILQWTQFTGYIRLIFVVVALIFISIGLLGVLINFFKPRTSQKLILRGGIASVSLLTALWLGLLDLHIPLFGSTDVGSLMIWDSSWGIADWSISRTIFYFFGGGWLKPAFAGAILLVLTNAPRWWNKFS
ncbi:hypothetical protein ACFLVC_02690 [Chloroflexota bacterium]